MSTWIYFIPHPLQRNNTTSEDIYLLNREDKKLTFWLTVTGLGFFGPEKEGMYQAALFNKVITEMGEKEFWIDDGEMYVNEYEFGKNKLLDWVRVWLKESGYSCQNLKEGSLEEFRKYNPAINAFETAFEEMARNYFSNPNNNNQA